MAYEVKPWKQPDCELSLKVSALSDRETFSREINETYGEGGGLNADYRMVEALAMVSNVLGSMGFYYGVHFIFKTGGNDTVILDFCNEKTKSKVACILAKVVIN